MVTTVRTNIPPKSETAFAAPPVCDECSEGNDRVEVAESDALLSREQTSSSLWTRPLRFWRRYWDVRRTPAFLLSLVLHTAILLILALLSLPPLGGTQRSFDFIASVAPADASLDSIQLLATDGDAPPPPTPLPEDSRQPAPSTELSADTLVPLLNIPEKAPARTAAESLAELLEATANSPTAAFASTGISGRTPDQRRHAALSRGGSVASEEAVERALDWLAEHQQPNGGWSLVHDGGKCNGRCPNNGSTERFDPAATGLSLLAFLGAGYTHREGKHRDTVRKGIYFLQQILEETPQGGSFLFQSERGMYNHGIASFALCEAYQLTLDKDLKLSAQQAIDFISSAQNYQGGWGYLPKQPGDLTLSGWQIMALKSAFAAGLDVPPATILRIDAFLDSQQTPSTFFYGYGKPGKSSTCTAIGLLLRLFRGKPHTDATVLAGADFLAKSTRPGVDAYYNYYSTLFLFHMGQPFWESWNARMREHLIATQSKVGHQSGSWFFEDPYGREGGRVYTTAMCAMTLEVYYRFAPIYQQTELNFVP